MAVHLHDADVLVHIGQLLSKPFPNAHEPSLHHHCPGHTHQPHVHVTNPGTSWQACSRPMQGSLNLLCHTGPNALNTVMSDHAAS